MNGETRLLPTNINRDAWCFGQNKCTSMQLVNRNREIKSVFLSLACPFMTYPTKKKYFYSSLKKMHIDGTLKTKRIFISLPCRAGIIQWLLVFFSIVLNKLAVPKDQRSQSILLFKPQLRLEERDLIILLLRESVLKGTRQINSYLNSVGRFFFLH